MKKQIIMAYIVGIHQLLGLVLIKTDFVPRVAKKLGVLIGGPPEITDHFRLMLRLHSRMDGNVPDGAVVFIGDSITEGLCVSAVAPLSVNYGIANDTSVGVLERLSTYQSIHRASAVVIAIGVNDLKRRSNEEILRNYSAIADRLPQDVPVIFSAVLPVDERVRTWRGLNVNRIRALNAELKAFCARSGRLLYLDAGPLLVDSTGNLAREYADGDGIHLNSKGNAIWIAELRKKVEEAQQSASRGNT